MVEKNRSGKRSLFGMVFKRNREAERAKKWAAFAAEALPHMEALFRVAMWLLGQRDHAEDLVQETFTQALQSFHRFEKGTNRTLSLLLTDLNRSEVSAGAASPGSTDAAQQVFAYPQLEDYQVAGFATPRHVAFIISDLSEAENLSLARTLAPSVYSHIARAERVA